MANRYVEINDMSQLVSDARLVGVPLGFSVFPNSTLSPTVYDYFYYQDTSLEISYGELRNFTSGNTGGTIQGMQGTAISGATFGNWPQSSQSISHVFYQAQNGSIIDYGLGEVAWVDLGEIPLG